MADIKDIRNAYFEKGLSISHVARDFSVDRKTVRKFLEQQDWNAAVRVSELRASVLDPYKGLIDSWLENDRLERKKQRHTATRVHARLCEEQPGFQCSYRTVAMYVSERKKAMRGEHHAVLPLQRIPGEAEADFGEADFFENGQRYSGSYLTVSFPHSNAGYLQLFKGQNLECLVTGLIAIFDYLGGVPHRVRLDNASTMVTKILGGGKRELTEGFLRFCEHFGIEPVFCNPASGNEKGNVENKVGYGRRNYLVPVPQFSSIEQYNRELLERCSEDHKRVHYGTGRIIADMLAEDLKALGALARIPFDPNRYETLRADAYGMVSLQNGTHRYSTAPKFARSLVTVRMSAHEVSVLDESMREIVSHKRLYGRERQQRMDWLPYLTQLSRRPAALKYSGVYAMMPEPLQQWVERQPRDAVGKALSVIAELTERSDFHTACAAVSDSLRQGVCDADSLEALYDRITRYAGLGGTPTPVAQRIPTPTDIGFDPARYDQMMPEAHS